MQRNEYQAVVIDNVFCGTNDGPPAGISMSSMQAVHKYQMFDATLMRQKNTLTLSAADSLSIKKSIKVNKKGQILCCFWDFH